MRRGVESLRPPILLEHFLSGTEIGEESLIWKTPGFRSIGDYPGLQRELSPVREVLVQILNQG